jgi:hypothetical protein
VHPGADRDDDRHDELHDAGAEVATSGVEAEGLALLGLGEEERDVRHRGGEVAAAEAGERRDEEQNAEGRLGPGHDPGERERGEEQQQGADDRPVAPAETGNGEGVGDADGRAHEAGQRDEPELLVEGQGEAGAGQERDHDAPQGPDTEAEELREDRPGEVASRDGTTGGEPETPVLGFPVIDPATRMGPGDIRRGRGGGGSDKRGAGVHEVERG